MLESDVEEADQQNAGQATERQFAARAAWTELQSELDQQSYDGIFAGEADQQNAGQRRLRDIKPLRELFQPREEHEKHTNELRDALKIHGVLDPITVGWTGKRAVLIDGHHRFKAYWKAGKANELVPVRWFAGSIKEAVALSRSENAKDKLPMTTQEKQNAAWMLVRLETYTRPQIKAATGVSDGQIGTMRRVLKAHRADVIGFDSWYRARQLAAGRGFEPLDDDERNAELLAKAKRFNDRLWHHFRGKLASNPDLFALVLDQYMGRNLVRLRSAIDRVLHERGEEPDPDDETPSDF